MSGANDKVYPKDASLLALTGQIAVHFLDGDIIEGEFTTQDAYNIFVTVDNEPMMIPRHQIKFIKGKHVDQLAADNSQSNFGQAQPAPATAPSPKPEAEPAAQAEASAPVPAPVEESQPEETDEDDETFVLSSDDIEEFAAMADETEEDDETFVLPPVAEETAVEADEEDDDATFILPADTGQPAAGEEDDDETFVLSPGTGELVVEDEDEEDDATFILPPGADQASIEDEDEEDGTVVLDSDLQEIDDTEKAAVILEEDENDATMVVSEKEQLEETTGITASLVCTSGPHSGQIFKVEGERTTLGRSSDNDVPLSGDKEISRHHAIISQESGKFIIQDQDSLNGTFVNNEQVTSPRYLENEDMILVGITTLKYQED